MRFIKITQKICKVRADTFFDAYGFCLSALFSNPDTISRVIVVNNESTYHELVRFHKGKIFILSFPFSEPVPENNNTILCFSKESNLSDDMRQHNPYLKRFLLCCLRYGSLVIQS